jgi:hypothetical protein
MDMEHTGMEDQLYIYIYIYTHTKKTEERREDRPARDLGA